MRIQAGVNLGQDQCRCASVQPRQRRRTTEAAERRWRSSDPAKAVASSPRRCNSRRSSSPILHPCLRGPVWGHNKGLEPNESRFSRRGCGGTHRVVPLYQEGKGSRTTGGSRSQEKLKLVTALPHPIYSFHRLCGQGGSAPPEAGQTGVHRGLPTGRAAGGPLGPPNHAHELRVPTLPRLSAACGFVAMQNTGRCCLRLGTRSAVAHRAANRPFGSDRLCAARCCDSPAAASARR